MAKKTLLDNIIESIKGIDGQLINQSGTTKQMISDLNYKVVAPAKSAADSAVSAADAAVASAQVTSDAVSAIASATAEAKQGANEAMSRALSAWDVATGAKEAVTDFDPLLKSAQSDASQALAQIADTATALSNAKTSFGSDVAEAKQLANTAQTTANSAVESASENARELASQANALSDTKKAMDSGIASAMGMANVAQTTADSAIKSAASVASDLTAVASQAKSNADGITKVTSDVGLLQTTVADNSGNISSIQETAKQIQQAVSDNAGNITTAKQTADSAIAVASDAKSNATVAVQTASGASVTAGNAQSDATTAMVTAKGAVTQASDAKSNATIAVQTASEASVTATNAQGDASIAKQTASDASIQIKNAQGDISSLQTRAGKIEANVATNSGAIANVQVTANQLKASVSDNAGNITTAKQTADSAVTVASDARSNATVAIQTASQASITASSASGQAASAVITANGALTTASNAKSDATEAVQTASGASLTATNAQSDATIAKQTASEATVQASNANSSFAQLSIRANKIETNVSNNSSAIASVQQTANGLTTTVGKVDNRVKTIEDKTNWATMTGPLDMNTLTTTQNIYYRDTNLTNSDGEAGWAYIQVVSTGERVTQTVWHDRSSIQHTRTGAVSGSSYNWDAWNKTATDAQVTQVKQTIDGIATTINDPKTGLNATYQTAAGNATTISNVKGDVSQLQSTANGLTSRVGSLESKTATQQTTIDQNKAAIALKADQTDVNTLKGTVSQNTATLKTQADQIQSKVSASDVTGMLTGYATQSYAQSLVTQTADKWNLNLTNLQTDVNAIKTTGGGVNLQQGTGDCSLPIASNGPTITIEKFDNYTNMIHAVGNGSGFYSGYNQNSFTPETGKTYTFSCDIKGQGQISGGGLRYEGGDSGSMGTVTLTDNWTRISNTIHVNAISGAWVIYPDPINGKVDFYVKHIMIEEGIVAHPWSPAPSDMATVTSMTNLSATVDGIKGLVETKADQSEFTQLSDLVQTKVSSDDFTSTTTQLKNEINQRVQVGDVISQINQEAGGNTLIQVSNGKGSLILDAENTIITGKAWIPSAALADLTADDITTGTLKGVDIDFRNASGQGVLIKDSTVTFDDGAGGNKAGYISFSSMPIADWPSGTGGNELQIKYGESLAIIAAGDTNSRALFSTVDTQIGYHQQGDTSANWGLTGLKIDNTDRQINLGVYGSNGKWSRFLANSGSTELNVDATHCTMDGGRLHFYKDNDNNSSVAVELQVDGWAWVRGWVEAAGHSQHSILSSKTRIEEADPDQMLDLVNNTDLTTFAFKSEVAEGIDVRHIGPIIDDVNDVAKYKIPSEFIAPTKTARDDDNMIGALFGAVQALTKRIKTLESKVG